MWMHLEPNQQAALRRVLAAAPGPDSALVLERLDFYADACPLVSAYRGAVDASDELEVQDDGVVSYSSDGGAWVMAWVFVTDEDAGVEPEEEDEGEEDE